MDSRKRSSVVAASFAGRPAEGVIASWELVRCAEGEGGRVQGTFEAEKRVDAAC